MAVAENLGEGKRGIVINGYWVSVLQGKERSGDWLHSNVNILTTAELYTLKNGQEGKFLFYHN